MRLKQPFHKVYRNVLITTENEVWAYFTCPSEYVIGQNKEVQEKHKRKWQQFLQSLRRFEDFELFLNPHSYNLNERLSAFSKSFDEQAQNMGDALIDRTLSELESQLRVITTEKFYIGVKLSSLSSATSLKGKAMELVDYYAGKLLAITQYHMTVDEVFLARYRIIEAEVFQLVGAINGRRLTEKEVLQVCRYPYVRGMNTSFDSDFIEKEGYSLTDTILDPTEEQGLLKLRSLEGTSYIALLPIHKFAPNLAFNHVAELVQSVPFPVEFRLKAHFEPLKGGKGLKGKSSRASKRLKNSAKETLSMGDAEMKSSRFNRYALTDLNNKIDLRVPVIK